MNARVDGAQALSGYLDVRYSAEEKPYTAYPEQLCRYLTQTHLRAKLGGKLLDLGSGRGEFLHGFARQGFAAQGVDRSLPSDRRFDEPMLVADFERQSLPFADGSFDVIFNKSVLEHLQDVSHVLAECRRVLAPGGLLLSMVPDWRSQWRHFYDDWTHVRPFTMTGLSQCLESHGYRVLHAEHFLQLPLLWKHRYLAPLARATAFLPDSLKHYKWVRFSKEKMLLVVAEAA